MSIYATQWEIKMHMPKWVVHFFKDNIPHVRYKDGHEEIHDESKDWIEIYCQGVPGHIGHISCYPNGDPYHNFLPPALTCTEAECYNQLRAVVIVTEGFDKKVGQAYIDPLLIFTGEEYNHLNFSELMEAIGTAAKEKLGE